MKRPVGGRLRDELDVARLPYRDQDGGLWPLDREGDILTVGRRDKSADCPNYPAGSSGPAASDELLAGDGRYWYGTTDQG